MAKIKKQAVACFFIIRLNVISLLNHYAVLLILFSVILLTLNRYAVLLMFI